MPSNREVLRILVLVSGYPSDVTPTNGTFHETSVRALSRLGCRVFVAAPVPFVPRLPGAWLPRRYREYARLSPHEIRDGVEILRPRYLATPRENLMGAPHMAIRNALTSVFAAVGRIDVVHGHFAYPHGVVAVGLGAARRVSSVLTLHGSDTNAFPTVNRLARRRFIRAVREADAVTAVSDALADRASEISGRRPVVLPVGIDRDRFQATGDQRHESRRIRRLWLTDRSPDTKFVLFVGRYTEAKGVGDLLAAFSRLRSRPVVGVFAGGGPLAHRLRESDRLIDLGRYPNEEIPSIMGAADAVVLPSHGEGLPTVLVEAGALGVPTIATSVGGVPEFLGPDRGWLVAPRRPDRLAAVIERAVLDEPHRSQVMAERLRRHVEEHHDANVNAARLVEVYESVLAA